MAGSRSGSAPFIYQGSGKKQSSDQPAAQRLCTKQACAIQHCMARYNSRQDKCEAFVDAWRKCCDDVDRRIKLAAEANK